MQQWCNVKVRKFEFEKYPAHVKILFSYAFKPIVVAVSMIILSFQK